MANPDDQSVVEHLGELRTRLLLVVYGFVIGFALCWWKSEWLFDIVRSPIVPFLKEGGLVFTGILDKFTAHLKIAMLGAIILTCPWWLYQLWSFIAPGLYKKERKFAVLFMFFGTFLFMSGASFVYYVVYPAAFKFLLHFGGDTDIAMITIDSYLDFFFSTTLIFGACFELPLVLALLGMLGIIDDSFLRKNRRYAVVVLAAISAIITPPDLMSMLFLLGPMMVLYEIGIIVVRMLAPKRTSTELTNT